MTRGKRGGALGGSGQRGTSVTVSTVKKKKVKKNTHQYPRLKDIFPTKKCENIRIFIQSLYHDTLLIGTLKAFRSFLLNTEEKFGCVIGQEIKEHDLFASPLSN